MSLFKTIKHSGKLFGSTSEFKKGMETRQRKMKSAENQLTIMLLLVTTLFIVLQIPTYARYIYITFVTEDTPSKFSSSILFLITSYALMVTNNGIIFFLYCTSGQKFRHDLKEMLCCNLNTCRFSTSEMKSQNESQSSQVFTVSASQNTQNSTIHSDHKGSIQ